MKEPDCTLVSKCKNKFSGPGREMWPFQAQLNFVFQHTLVSHYSIEAQHRKSDDGKFQLSQAPTGMFLTRWEFFPHTQRMYCFVCFVFR